jgi:hypothetical protein
MAFTADQQLETQAAGQADWDTALNGNFAIIERGRHLMAVAGSVISSGQVCVVGSGGFVLPMNAASTSLFPHLISYKSVGSGEQTQFLLNGNVRSMTVWSGHITPGLPVHVSVQSLGFLVSSFAGCGEAAGLAVGNDAIVFNPGQPRTLPSIDTNVNTVGPVTVGSFTDFVVPVGRHAIVRDLTYVGSHNRLKIQFWSGSARSASELVYETLTSSAAPASADVTSTYYKDRALFPHDNTDANSGWYMYGRITAQSGSGVSSAYANFTIISERVR